MEPSHVDLMRKGICIAGALLMVAACESADVGSENVHRAGVPSLFTYAAADREMTTVVIGDPFGIDKADFGRAVTDAMQNRNRGARTHFTTTPSDNARPDYRVLMIFDPVANPGQRTVCRDAETLETRADDDRVTLRTVFCYRDEALSEARTTVAKMDGPDEPAFERVVANNTWRLIPHRDPFLDRDRCRRKPC